MKKLLGYILVGTPFILAAIFMLTVGSWLNLIVSAVAAGVVILLIFYGLELINDDEVLH